MKTVHWMCGVFAVGALALGGCGGSISGLCNDFCDCTGCSDAELDECVDNASDDEKRADDEGCGDQFGELLDCYDDQFRCVDGGDVDLDGCGSEESSLNNCLN